MERFPEYVTQQKKQSGKEYLQHAPFYVERRYKNSHVSSHFGNKKYRKDAFGNECLIVHPQETSARWGRREGGGWDERAVTFL